MEKYQICQTHQEKVDFICRDVNTNELAGICLHCLPLPQGVPYESKKNVLINIENNKLLMIKHTDEQKEQNVQIIRKLIDYLNQYKKTQVEQIDQIIIQGEQEIKQIEKKCLHSQNQISDYNASIDVEQLKLFYNTLQNETSLDQTQKLLFEMVLSIQQEPIILNSFQILQQFQCLLNLDLQNAENVNQLKKVYKCSKHNQMILGVNFDKSKTAQAICIDCIKKENLSFTKLEEVENSWEGYQSKSKLCYQNLQNQVQKIVSQKHSLVLQKFTNQQRKLGNLLINLENYKNSKMLEFNQLISQQTNASLDYTAVQQLEQLKDISKLSNDHWEIFEREIQKLQYFIECNHIDNCRSFRPLNQFINHITNIKINQVQQAKIKYEQISLVILTKSQFYYLLNVWQFHSKIQLYVTYNLIYMVFSIRINYQLYKQKKTITNPLSKQSSYPLDENMHILRQSGQKYILYLQNKQNHNSVICVEHEGFLILFHSLTFSHFFISC